MDRVAHHAFMALVTSGCDETGAGVTHVHAFNGAIDI